VTRNDDDDDNNNERAATYGGSGVLLEAIMGRESKAFVFNCVLFGSN
jgi:hypothetical protein